MSFYLVENEMACRRVCERVFAFDGLREIENEMVQIMIYMQIF